MAIMRLEDFPRPPSGSSRGVHGSASTYPKEGDWRSRLALCRDMGIGFYKFIDIKFKKIRNAHSLDRM